MGKRSSFLFIVLISTMLMYCNSTNSNSESIYRNVAGYLNWGYSPAADGTGMTFVSDSITYGISGTYQDYEQYFETDQFRVNIYADYKLTGNETIRGWGVTYPEIELLRIEIRD